MTVITFNPSHVMPAEASERLSLMVELTLLRRRMVRDLEQFLAIELSNPCRASLRLDRKARFGAPLAASSSVSPE
ncbi:MAG TPA: hypothetical protein VIM11_09735 [Tepidisphaeraceae bacterium]|jgi:hypothetical protein